MTTPRPWTTSQLKKLGEAIRDDRVPAEGLPPYPDVMSWFNDLAADVQLEISGIDFERVVGEPISPEITSRAKTIDTLREKLIRDHGMALPSIQDIAGVRVDAAMTLREQDAVARAIAEHFDHDPTTALKDLRSTPHSGYRAVHVWLRLEGRVEVQVRTTLQSEWANLYEALGDRLGRGIRYGELPEDPRAARVVEQLRALSLDSISPMEEGFNAISQLPTVFAPLVTVADDPSLQPALRAILQAGLPPRETVRALEAELQTMLRTIRYALAELPKS